MYFYNQALQLKLYATIVNVENNIIYSSWGVALTDNHHFKNYDDITSCPHRQIHPMPCQSIGRTN